MGRQIWEHSPQIHVTFDITVTIQKIKIIYELRVWDVFVFAENALQFMKTTITKINIEDSCAPLRS